MFGLVRSGTDGAQLGLEGAHCGTVAVSPTARVDGDPHLLFSRLDGESNVAEHEAVRATSRNGCTNEEAGQCLAEGIQT
jgi:hypothetical protein